MALVRRRRHRHVAAYLAELDISAFDPKAPPPKTAAFWDIVDANRAPEDAELADVLDQLGNPDAVLLSQIVSWANEDFAYWLRDPPEEAEGQFPIGLSSAATSRYAILMRRTGCG